MTSVGVTGLIRQILYTWCVLVAIRQGNTLAGIWARTQSQIAEAIFVNVVDEDRRGPRNDVKGVQGADGQVVGGSGGVVEAECGDGGVAGRGLEQVADFEVLGFDEGGLGFVVERVVVGRRDRSAGGGGRGDAVGAGEGDECGGESDRGLLQGLGCLAGGLALRRSCGVGLGGVAALAGCVGLDRDVDEVVVCLGHDDRCDGVAFRAVLARGGFNRSLQHRLLI